MKRLAGRARFALKRRFTGLGLDVILLPEEQLYFIKYLSAYVGTQGENSVCDEAKNQVSVHKPTDNTALFLYKLPFCSNFMRMILRVSRLLKAGRTMWKNFIVQA